MKKYVGGMEILEKRGEKNKKKGTTTTCTYASVLDMKCGALN